MTKDLKNENEFIYRTELKLINPKEEVDSAKKQNLEIHSKLEDDDKKHHLIEFNSNILNQQTSQIGFLNRSNMTNLVISTPVRRLNKKLEGSSSRNNRKCLSTENYRSKMQHYDSEKEKEIYFSPFKLKFSHSTFVSTGPLLELQKKYHLKGIIGQGSYGVVRVAVEILTNAIRAIKIMNKNKIRQINPKDVERINAEVKIMKKLHHPNIARLYEVYEDEHYICLIMELCHGGNLLDKLLISNDENKGAISIMQNQICQCPECSEEMLYDNLSEDFFEPKMNSSQIEELIANIMKQIFSALQYLHNQGISHRDIKPENFLFSTRLGFDIRLVDFGLSKEFYVLSNGEYYGMTTKAGTPYFVAPEVLNGNNSSYGPKCDIWSAGVLLHLLLLGVLPFPGSNDADTISQVINKKLCFNHHIYNNISSLAKDLLKKLLNRNVEERLDAKSALRHPWFNQFTKQNIIEVNDNKILDNKLNILSNSYKSYDLNLFPMSILKSLKRYYVSPLLKKIALTIIARYCPDKWIENLRNIFYKLDIRLIGKIKISDLRIVIQYIVNQQNLKIPSHHIDLLLDAADSDGNGEIDYIEFVAAAISPNLSSRKDILILAFKTLDQDEDGYISTQDIRNLINDEKIKLFSNSTIDIDDNTIIEDLNVEISKDNEGNSKISFQAFEQIINTNYDKVCKCYHNPIIEKSGLLSICGEDSMDNWYDDLLSANTENENTSFVFSNDRKSLKRSVFVCRRTGFKNLNIFNNSKLDLKRSKSNNQINKLNETDQNTTFSLEHNRKRSLDTYEERNFHINGSPSKMLIYGNN